VLYTGRFKKEIIMVIKKDWNEFRSIIIARTKHTERLANIWLKMPKNSIMKHKS